MAATKKRTGKKPTGHKQQPAHPAQTHSDNPGNFANDRERAAEAGRKGGQHSRQQTSEKQ